MISGSTAYSVSLRSLAELQSQELELLVSFVVADRSAVCALPSADAETIYVQDVKVSHL